MRKNWFFYQHIKHVIGGGNIYKLKSKNACRYIISDKFTVIKIINLIIGKFRTPKLEYLHKAIKYFNIVHNTNIDILALDNSNIFYTPWLAGMADADSCFQISLLGSYGLKNSIGRGRIICSFTLT